MSNPLLQSASWLEDLFDDANDLIQVVQLDGTLLYVNKTWSTLLGYHKEEVYGRSIYSFVEEKDRARYQAHREQVIAGTVADVPIVFSLQSKTGQHIPVEGMLSVKKADGIPLYTRGIFRDITLRLENEARLHRLNEELKEREQNLQQLLQHAPDAVIVIDQESLVTYWNPKAEALFGWRAEEVLQQRLSSTIIPPQHREAHEKGMQRYLATGEARVLHKTIEITALHKSGQEFHVALTISSTLQDGKTAFIAFLRDISEQKRNQRELEHKTKQLEQSNAYLEDFAHAASHDLKEPLRKIRIFIDRLKSSLGLRLNEAEAQLLKRVETSTERMDLLVDDLLEFSYVSESPKVPEAVNLNEEVEKVMVDLELPIEEKGAQIIINPLPTVFGNQRQLQQLFHNLVGNALKYSKPEVAPVIHINSCFVTGGEVPIHLPEEQKKRSFYLIEVSDNGIGFKPQYAKQIFEIFKRLHGKGEYAGTGVGLAIVRKVVENHQGQIWATGTPGEGATFHVLLPAVE